MNADDFRDYMLSFLFLRYLLDNDEAAARKELGSDYPKVAVDEAEGAAKTPLGVWYDKNKKDVANSEKQMRRKVPYVIKPDFLWDHIVHLAECQDSPPPGSAPPNQVRPHFENPAETALLMVYSTRANPVQPCHDSPCSAV